MKIINQKTQTNSKKEDSEGRSFYISALFLAFVVISIIVYFFYQYMYENPDLYPNLQKGYEGFAVILISFWAIPLASIVPYSMNTENKIKKLFGFLAGVALICLITLIVW